MSILHIISVASGSRSIQLIERIGIIIVLIFVIWESIAVFKTVSLTQIAHWSVPVKQKMATGAAIDYVAAFNLAWVTAGADFTRFTARKDNATLAPWLGAMVGVVWFAFIGLISTIGIAITSGVLRPEQLRPLHNCQQAWPRRDRPVGHYLDLHDRQRRQLVGGRLGSV